MLGRIFGLAALGMGMECIPILFLMAGEFGIALILHLLIVALIGSWICYICAKDPHLPFLFLFMLLAAGPFGAGIFLLAVIVYKCCPKTAVSPDEWIRGFFSQEEAEERQHIYERIAFGMEDTEVSDVKPFQDILNSGTVLEKQIAIAKITRYFRSQFAVLLKQAVQDTNAAVRVQAATALTKLERDFMMKLMHIEKALKSTSNPGAIRMQLVQLCDDYAHAGLLDKNSQNELRQKAITMYEECLSHGEDFDLRLRLARLYLRQDQPDKTCGLLQDAAESGDITPQALLWYMAGCC
jgi:polysaccharide biosynthesis protein PelE